MARKIILAVLLLLLLGLTAGKDGAGEGAAPVTVTPASTDFPVEIRGRSPFADALRESLAYLLDAAPDDYTFVTEQISSIEIDPGGGSPGARADVKTKTVRFTGDWRYEQYGAVILSRLLIREATHIWLYENNYLFYGPGAEKYGVEQKVHTYILLN